MNKLSKEKKDRIVIIAVVTSVLTLAIWFGGISAQKARIAELHEKITEWEDKIGRGEMTVRRARFIRQTLQEQIEKLAVVEERLIPAERTGGNEWMLARLSNLISTRGYQDRIRISNLDNTPLIGSDSLPIPNFPYKAAAYGAVLVAHFHDFGKFLADLENTFPYMSVQNVQITPLTSTGSTAGAYLEDVQGGLRQQDREKLQIQMKLVVLVRQGAAS